MIFEKVLDMIGLGKKQTNRFALILDETAGPIPWYLQPFKHRIETRNGVLLWEKLADKEPMVGKVLLKAQDKALAIFNMYNWILQLGNRHLVVWNQKYVKDGPTNPVNVYVFDCDSMQPINADDKAYEAMSKEGTDIVYNGGLVSQMELQTTDAQGLHRVKCPEVLHQVDELLLLAHSSGVNATNDENNVCIVSLKPKEGTYEFMPQHWFNKGGGDFGYEWITRVNRDSETGNIICDGIRIGRFMLDKTGTQKLRSI